MRNILTVMLVSSIALVGCKKKDATTEGDKTGDMKGGDKAGDKGADLPALTADPDFPAITAADTPPFDSVKFRMTAKRTKSGWPEFEAANMGTKDIGYMTIYGYAYDKDGKQLARTKVPLSWNGTLAAGKKSDWPITLGGMGDDAPAGATAFQACYSGYKYAGDAAGNITSDDTKCPDPRPKK